MVAAERLCHLFHFVTCQAAVKIAIVRPSHSQSRGNELHLLTPFQAESLLNAGVAIHATFAFKKKIADPFWNSP